MSFRAVEAILPPDNLHFVGDGFRVYGILGRKEPLTMKRMSPFLLMDYAPVHYFPPNNGAPLGVGSHPHRGIETVTIAYKGKDEAGPLFFSNSPAIISMDPISLPRSTLAKSLFSIF